MRKPLAPRSRPLLRRLAALEVLLDSLRNVVPLQ